jgi:SPP1 family predicted phage head-tail adaptor
VIRAGRHRCRVRIERAIETTNAVGGKTRSWASIATRWARIEPLSGDERLTAQQTQSSVTHRIFLRAGGLSITPKDRIAYGSRVFGISACFDVDERGHELELAAQEDTDP